MRANDRESLTDTPCTALMQYIEQQATSRCDAIQRESEQVVVEIRAGAQAERDRMLAGARADLTALEQEVIATAVGQARWQAKATRVAEIGEAVDRVLDLCLKRLRELASEPGFESILESLLLEAVDHACKLQGESRRGEPIGVVLVAPADLRSCEKIISRKSLSLTVQADPEIWGGVVIFLAESSNRIINTLSSRMERMTPELRSVATKRLKGTSAGDEKSG